MKRVYLVSLMALVGCGALLGKSDPMNVRYFTPTSPGPAGLASAGAASGLPLRLGRIEGAEHLRERMAFRTSEHELGYHEGLRWTERPETYFRRALGRELFESGRFAPVIGGVVPTLDAELLAFEDLRERKAVRVEARVLLSDGRQVLLERTFRMEAPRGDEKPQAIAEALSRALQACVAGIAGEVQSALSASAPPVAEASR